MIDLIAIAPRDGEAVIRLDGVYRHLRPTYPADLATCPALEGWQVGKMLGADMGAASGQFPDREALVEYLRAEVVRAWKEGP